MTKIECPKCGRVLGETKDSLKANLCCRGCKNKVSIQILVAKTADYLPERNNEDD